MTVIATLPRVGNFCAGFPSFALSAEFSEGGTERRRGGLLIDDVRGQRDGRACVAGRPEVVDWPMAAEFEGGRAARLGFCSGFFDGAADDSSFVMLRS